MWVNLLPGCDDRGNVKTQTDGENFTTTFEYDDFDRLTRTIDPLSRTLACADTCWLSRTPEGLWFDLLPGYDDRGNVETPHPNSH